MAALHLPKEMICKFTNRWNGRCRGWAVCRLPDGSDSFKQSLPVYKTKRKALDLATRFYVSWLARHGHPWDDRIDPSYRDTYDCYWSIAQEQLEPIVLIPAA